MAQPPNFIDGMVIDQLSISVKEEPGLNYKLQFLHSKININYFYCIETSPNPYSGLYPLSNSSVLGQHSPMYNSRTPSPLEYQFPNVNSNSMFGQTTLLKTSILPPTGKLILILSDIRIL